jgi:alpha-ketoglutarate-dependent taurine dioxygenase
MSTTAITPMDGPLGVVLTGLDLHGPLSDDDRATVRRALADRLLVSFPDQHLSLAEEERFAASFGPLWLHPAARHSDAAASVVDSRRAPRAGRAAEVWHADATFTVNPPAYTMLSAQVLPEHGGATSFANQQLAWDHLDPDWRRHLEGLRAVHAPGPMMLRRAAGLGEVLHPVVRVDGTTTRRSLFVNPGFTRRFEHQSAVESRPTLGYLFRVGLDPSVRLDYTWQPGDLVVWDNRSLLHRAHHDHGDDARVLTRVTVAA